MNYLLPAQAAGQFLSLFVFATLARWYVVPWLKTEDVDQERIRFKDLVREFVLEPTTQPWATGRCCFATPTAISSISMRRFRVCKTIAKPE